MTDNSLLDDFADETREHLEELEGSLLRLESDPTNSELLNTIFRSMHTIKGASEYLGFERIARLSHRLESLLDLFRDGKLLADKVAVDLLIDARDRISDLISQVEASGHESSDIEDLLERVDAISTGTASTEGETENATVYEGEADTELFEIFMEQLSAGINQLLETAIRVSRQEGVPDAVAEMADQVDRLSSTANYMGYDALSAEYDKLHTAISGFSSRSATAGEKEIETFLKTTLGSAIERIQNLFPEASFQQVNDRLELLVSGKWSPQVDHPELVLDEQDSADETKADAFDRDLSESLDFENELLLDPENPPSQADLAGDDDGSLLGDFADETREHLEELEGSLLRLESDPTNSELLNTIFRSMHTIKGASEYLGFERIARLSHRLESLLDLFRDGKLLADKVAVDLLIDARDRISDLISQVEASGHESSDIEDLLERVDAISTGTASTEGETENATVYEGEADTELFEIFMEQLSAGIEQFLETAGRVARQEGVPDAVAEMADQVDRLSSTANYMGYDALSAEYDKLHTAISEFSSRSATAGEKEIETFLQTTIGSAIEQIQNLFPNAKSLSAIDTSMLSPAPLKGAPSNPSVEADIRPSSDFEHLLAGLPSIDDRERDVLLSKSLDETFSSMRNGDHATGTEEDIQVDQDPISMQFSSEIPEHDIDPPPSGATVEDDQAPSIFDDFIEDAKDAFAAPSHGTVEEDQTGLSTDSDENLDLWPKATEISTPVSEGPLPASETTIPVIDFSTPPSSDTAPVEDAGQKDFVARSTTRQSIRVDADKVDHLMNQVGELVVNRSSFSQLYSEMRDLTRYLYQRFQMDKADQRLVNGLTNRLSDATTILGRVTSELQEQVMKVRMLPISRLFNRYPRLVHDLLRDGDKKVQLQFRGEETELDRMVIEQLADPMIHIIRNAVDHGIETRAERQRKGKPESGVLLLEAYHEGSNVIIEVTDDGKGIDLSRIRQKAVEKKLADRKTLEEMDQQALIDMIMLPGFSTTDQITHTSGRGVGMDVVKRSIEKINGTLIVDTRQDVGTRFRIKIPLTLAIIPAMMIHCGGSHFTLPMSAVEETLRIDRGEIFTVDGSEIMHLREEPLPLVKLADLLNMRAAEPSSAISDQFFVVVVKGATGRTGFIVDTLMGRQEVVIKPMEDYLQENSGFSGATILGDGNISLVLNVDELVIMAREKEAERKLAAAVL